MMRAVPGLEVWGGVECTVARVGDDVRDQLAETGHDRREDDLDRVAALGIRTLRYPILWERVAPDRPDERDWRWTDRRFGRLRELGIAPIAGLLHHGSGPRYTSLVDPAMPQLLAQHAGAVAARYPWIVHYTPVNEPLTTARFSGLYGHWYPHGRDQKAFLRALVNQCQAVILAMRAIRRHQPAARLVQTEDLGKAFATPLLQAQADYENSRRWLSLDLLCGRVDQHHPWHATMLSAGITAAELELLASGEGTPEIIGINHYLTSERYLDEAVGGYPQHHWNTDSSLHYADVEAVRIPDLDGQLGPKARLLEAWQRYGLPLAVTEAHHGATREEQLRWLREVWQAGGELRTAGVDIRAITVWALFGLVDWSSLLTRRNGHYEPGPFDARGERPRATALGKAAAELVRNGQISHPACEGQGWWRRAGRVYGPASSRPPTPPSGRTILIAGGQAPLARAVARLVEQRGHAHARLPPAAIAAASPAELVQTPDTGRPWAVIDVGELRWADHEGQAPATDRTALAAYCAEHGLAYLAFFSDRVFDGTLARGHVESDPTTAFCRRGTMEAAAERRLQAAHPQALLIRAGTPFGPWERTGFAHWVLHRARSGRPTLASRSHGLTPSYLPDLVHTALDLLIDGEQGIWHLANAGSLSWYEFADRLLDAAGLGRTTLHATDLPSANARLATERGQLLAPVGAAIGRFVAELQPSWA